MENYTAAANSRCFDFFDSGLYSAWDIIENTPEDTPPEVWKKRLTQISREYVLSSRLALIRILYSRAGNVELDQMEIPEEGLEFSVEEKTFKLTTDIYEYAENLSKEELEDYAEVWADIAAVQADADREEDMALILKALQAEKKKVRLTREEAFQLGHSLSFSLKEMSWFLLRVFDFEDGFQYNRSNDLIEAYGFLREKSGTEVWDLKEEYNKKVEGIAKKDVQERSENWTKNVSSGLPGLVEKWKLTPDICDICFMEWMTEQAPCLDQPSRTATEIYRRLAVYAYRMSEGKENAADTSEILSVVNKIDDGDQNYREAVKEELYEKGVLSAEKCDKLGETLLKRNKELYTKTADSAKAWRTITTDAKGNLKLIMAGRSDALRTRVIDLLRGDEQVEKGDMLHLLWFTFSLCWENSLIYTSDDIFNSLADFMESAEKILDCALLPAFYPPHLMEQSMMLSVVMSAGTGQPADIYAEICESLIRERKKKGIKK